MQRKRLLFSTFDSEFWEKQHKGAEIHMVTKLDLIIYMVNFSSNQHRKRALTNIVFTESKTFGSSNRYNN